MALFLIPEILKRAIPALNFFLPEKVREEFKKDIDFVIISLSLI